MQIRPAAGPDTYSAAFRPRAAALPVPSGDRVEARAAWTETADQLARGAALPPGPLGPPLLLAQQLAGQGTRFEVLGRNWLFQKTWKDADPEKVASELEKEHPQVRIQGPDEEWMPLENATRLSEYHAFHGGTPAQLGDPSLGRALGATMAPGAAFLAYAALSQGAPNDRESALFKAFEQGKLEPAPLARPELAEGLKELTERGYGFSSGSALATYLTPDNPPITLSHQDLALAEVRLADLKAPPLPELEAVKYQAERLRGQAGEQTRPAWDMIRGDGSDRPLAERVDLALQVLGPDQATLYPAVLRNTEARAPLQPTLDALQELARSVPARTAVEALELGRKEGYDPEHWQASVAGTRDVALARRALVSLEGKDYAARQAAFQELAAHSPQWAVEVAEQLGPQLAARGPELARLARDVPPATVLAAWRTCQEQKQPFEGDRLETSRQLLSRAGLDPGDWNALYSALPPAEQRPALLEMAASLQPLQPTLEGLKGLLSVPAESYPEVTRLASGWKNADQAVAAWTEFLQPARQSPDFAQRLETLEQMVSEKGWDKTRSAFVELSADTVAWPERMERLRLAQESWPDNWAEIYRGLRDAGLDAAQREAFGQLSGQLALKKQGDWALEGNRWANKLYVGATPKNSLELPVVSLEHLIGCRLTLTRQLDLRADANKASLEASTDGQTWKELASFPGVKSGPTRESVDLSPYDGKPLHLRFVVSAKHWDEAGPGEALVVSDFQITGQSLGQTTEVIRQADLTGPGTLFQEPARLPELARLAEAAGGARQALQLSQLCQPESWPALGQLAGKTGATAAGQIWPHLHDRAEGEAAGLAAELSEPQTALPTLLERTRQLAALELSPAGLAGLRQLAAEQPPWKTTGAWDADGQTWSNRLYVGASVDNELVSPPLSLAHLRNPQLCLSERHDLRVDTNLASVEVAEDGPDPKWVKLTEWKGKSDWTDQKLDLSAFQGKTVRLRFAVKPRSWTNDGPGEALAIRSLSLQGSSAWGPVSVPLGNDGSLWDQTFQGLGNLTGEQRDQALASLGQLASGLGDARQTLALWPLLLENPRDLEERTRALSELTNRMGPAAARSAWPLVDEGTGAEPARVRWLDIAARTTPEGSSLADLEPVYRELCARPLDETAAAALEGVLDHRPTFTREGVWETRQDPKLGPVWSNRLFVGAGRQNDLTTPPFQLAHLQSARLTWSHRQDLRVDKNTAALEITTDAGKTWTALESFAGPARTDWVRGEVDLSAYCGQTAQLRLRVAPTQWDDHGPGDAFELADLKVLGRSSASAPEQTVFEEVRNSSLVAEALKAAGGDSVAMVALGELAGKLENSDQALELWPALAPELGKPDFPARLQSMLDLASSCGVERTAKAWPLVSTQGPADPALRGRLFSLASRISEGTELAPTDLYRQMSGLDGPAISQVEELARALPDWTAVGTWSRGAGSSWINRLFVGAPREHHLTTPPLTLAGLSEVRLEFDEKHDLRVDSNTAGLEISTDGANYVSLQQFPGQKADWGPRSVDLSGYAGGTVQLRFRVSPTQWTNDGPGEALGIRDLRLKGRLQGQEVSLDLATLQGAAAQALASSSSESLKLLARLGPAQAWRVLGSLGQARALGLLEGRDPDRCLTRVLQALVVGDSLERAMESLLEGDGQALEERDNAVIVGGVKVGKRRVP